MKSIDWARYKDMSSKDKSEVNTAASFSDQRKDEEKRAKDFGMDKMEDKVNIEWPDED